MPQAIVVFMHVVVWIKIYLVGEKLVCLSYRVLNGNNKFWDLARWVFDEITFLGEIFLNVWLVSNQDHT